MPVLNKALFLLTIVTVVIFQVVKAADFSNLLFVKLSSPSNGEKVQAGKSFKINYSLKPVTWQGVANGYATNMNFKLLEGSGKSTGVHGSLTVNPDSKNWVSHSKQVGIPRQSKAGEYKLVISETVQLRRRKATAEQTFNINVVA
ncbi:hypothetical protein DFQ30_008338 [Apophysomyces sp. BC1015]|nr:hypothetical protein DFQ30_008338 [Apophysomyces sp. BC1015]